MSCDWFTTQHFIAMQGCLPTEYTWTSTTSPVVPQPLTWSPRTTAGPWKPLPKQSVIGTPAGAHKAVLTAACWQTCLIMFLIHRDPSGLPHQLSLKVTKPPILPGVFLRRITNRLHAAKMWEACPHACPALIKRDSANLGMAHCHHRLILFPYILPLKVSACSPALPPASS